MTENIPELQVKLQELDQELEDGEITAKGYQKRRTLILSQFFSPAQVEQVQRGLRVHNADDTVHPSNDASPNNSLAVDLRNSSLVSPTDARAPSPGLSNVRYSTVGDRRSPAPGDGSSVYANRAISGGQNQYGQPQERTLGVRNPDEPQGSYGLEGRYSSQQDISGYNTSADTSRAPTMMSSNYAFNPATEAGYKDQQGSEYVSPIEGNTRHSTMVEQGYFTDFAGQQKGDNYGGDLHRYSHGEVLSPSAAFAPPLLHSGDMPPPTAVNHQLPLEPRDVPFAVYDPHNNNVPMSKFDNIATVLRHRARTNAKSPAYWVLDPKGKETASITWDKFASRAEKVAQVIRDKSNLYRGDRVALIYRDTEVIDFAVALMGCFIAGVVGVPINREPGEDQRLDYQKLNLILTTTQAHLALTTETNLKEFMRDITQGKFNWPRGVEWWKTNEFSSFHPKKKDEVPPLVVPDLAYIEFSKAPTGDLRGVVMSHRTIMHQMACLSAIIATVSTGEHDTFNSGLRDKTGRLIAGGGAGEILLSYLDPRQGIGMILGVLLTVYGGHTTVWLESRAVESPGLYANLITKYKATLMAADYPGLKRAAYNYQSDPMTTRNFKKNFEPNFASVKLCLIDTLTVDCEFHEILADRWLRPMRNPRAREIVAPMLCLPEHGGMVISVRDWLGGEERMGCPLKLDLSTNRDQSETKAEEKPASASNGYSSLIGASTTQTEDKKGRTELSEVLVDKESLKTNEVVVVAIGEEARKRAATDLDTVRVGAFGYPIPDATLAVVDPETSLLCTPNVIGEIWVDSPSLSGGFWALPKHTESIFHARPYKFSEGNPTPMAVEPEFLRTGLLGTIIEGKVFVLGLYEDRLRQKVEWVEHGMEVAEYRYFFVQHLIISIMKNVPKIYDASAFDVYVNEEHLPIILLESNAASTAPTTSGGPPRQLDTALLDSLSERCMEVLYQEHHVRVYCVMITAPGTLPRTVKNGRREIGNMLCRKEFDLGTLPCVHVKFGVERAVLNLPVGVDPVGGIWSPVSAAARQDILVMQDKQYSGVDYREVVIDDRTSTPLNNFSSIVDLLQWRVARQAEELSYCTVDGRGKEGKGVNWKKFDTKVAAVALYMQNKAKIRSGDHVILMYTHSEEFVYAVHACFCLGAVVIPMAPLDQNRLNEDAPAFLHLVADFHVKAIIVNADVDHLLKNKLVSQHIKQSAQVLRVNLPPTYNTAKPPRQSSGCRELGLTMKPGWVQAGCPVLIWTYWTPDQRRIAVQLGHDTIMGMCKVQKETCQMTSSRPVLGCVRSTSGLGFIHTCLMGIFVGAPTYLVSPVDFASNPQSLFLTLSRYKIKDTYATSQMLDHAMNMMPGKGFTLHELKNMMISTEGRPRVDVFQKVRLHFASAGLDRTAINTIYSHVLNPMIASRSYMCIEPIELWLDTRALRRGLVYPVDPDTDPSALLVQDSGMVPVSTQIAIVNPETCRLCHIGEYGEIWVESEACVRSFYGSKDLFDAERFNGRTVDGDPHVTYVRTGDLGFLHNVTRPIGPNGQQVEMQVLFVLGGIGETFEVNGLSHFPMDIEYSVEKCHRNIVPSGW
jgi:acyl-CoA synthetase (AMP-forming)/AMP-acid ligase II